MHVTWEEHTTDHTKKMVWLDQRLKEVKHYESNIQPGNYMVYISCLKPTIEGMNKSNSCQKPGGTSDLRTTSLDIKCENNNNHKINVQNLILYINLNRNRNNKKNETY